MKDSVQNTIPRNKVIWLTGASGGLAHGLALCLSMSGAKLALHFRNPEDFRASFQEELDQHAADYIVTSGDLSEEGVAKLATEKILDKYGSLYALVHMAGPYAHGRVTKFSRLDFDKMISGNLTTFFECARVVSPILSEAGQGRIICFGMAGASNTQPMRFNGVHLASKSALTALAKTLALELAPEKVTVNVINPGRIDNKEISRISARNEKSPSSFPLPGFASWEDISEIVLFLLNPSSDYITGSVLDISGGWQGDDSRY